MLNTVHFDPWQRSLFVPSISSAKTKEKGPLEKEKGPQGIVPTNIPSINSPSSNSILRSLLLLSTMFLNSLREKNINK